MESPPLTENETIEREIPPSAKTVSYYAIKAAPLFGFWFIGLMTFLIYTYKLGKGAVQSLLFQALALSAFAYLVGIVARWLWRVDVSQRDAWLTNKGIWIQGPSGIQFVGYGTISSVKEKKDWMARWMRLEEIEIGYVDQTLNKKISLVGVENGPEVVAHIQGKIRPAEKAD